MPANVEEVYGYKQMAATGAVIGGNGGSMGGFLCTTSGTLALTETVGGATIVAAVAVTAGTFYPIPAVIAPGVGMTATLTGSAAGTFFFNP